MRLVHVLPAFLPLLLAGCGLNRAEKRVVGSWELDQEALVASLRAKIEEDPRALKPEMRPMVEALLQQLATVKATIELRPDRTYESSGKGLGRGGSTVGTWRMTGDTIHLEGPEGDDGPRTGKVSGGVMRFDVEQGGRKISITLNKKSSGTTPAAPR